MNTDPKTFFYLGVGCGSAVALALVLFGVAFGQDGGFAGIYTFFKDWQTLIAGMLALLAAVPTVFMLNEQIQLEQRRAQDAIERKQFAAKSSLPLALVELTKYADLCLKQLASLKENIDCHGVLRQGGDGISVPKLPLSAVQTVESCLESASASNRDALAGILCHLQIVNSRLEACETDRVTIRVRHNLITFIIDALELRRRVEHVFPYARGESETISTVISADELKTAAFFANLREDDWPGLNSELDRRSTAEC